uniref:Lymphocyte antigen 6 family member G6F n=1 Tax=Urocitellus parryii TaxID=9999 RepID=A0A8D2IAF0_UROPR
MAVLFLLLLFLCGLPQAATASMDASPNLSVPSMAWDVTWILMLSLTVGQAFTILALSIMLWRRRVREVQGRDASIPHFKPEIQIYENIHLARLSPPAHKTR